MPLQTPSAPLGGLKVLDLGYGISAPLVGLIYADHGADVVKVELKRDDLYDFCKEDGSPHPLNHILNRGKKSVNLNFNGSKLGTADFPVDLLNKEHVNVLKTLIVEEIKPDLVVENSGVDVLTACGLGPDDLRNSGSKNPGLVYLSLPAVSRSDVQKGDEVDLPNQAAVPDAVISALVGMAMESNLNRTLTGFKAAFTALPQASVLGGILGSMSSMQAIRARILNTNTNPVGASLEVPLATAFLEGLCYNCLEIPQLPERYYCRRELYIADAKQRSPAGAKCEFNLSWDEMRALLEPDYKTYMCKDGRPFYVVTIGHTTHIVRSWKVLGIERECQAIHDRYCPNNSDFSVWDNLSRARGDSDEGGAQDVVPVGKMFIPEPYLSEISALMEAAFKTKTAHEWQKLFFESNTTGAAVQTTQEWLKMPHLVDSGLMQKVKVSEDTLMMQPGPLVWIWEDTDGVAEKDDETTDCPRSPSTTTGPSEAGTESVPLQSAAGLDVLDKPVSTLREMNVKPWCQGLKVLDFCDVIAGPLCAGMLAALGADVVTIQPPKITYDPYELVLYGIHANQGKRSVLVDIRHGSEQQRPGQTPENGKTAVTGQGVLRRLIKWADVILWNGVERQLRAAHLTYAEVKKINPEIVFCLFDMYGGPRGSDAGEFSTAIGYDDLIQAQSGIMARCGWRKPSQARHGQEESDASTTLHPMTLEGCEEGPIVMEHCEEHAHVGTLDVPGGMSGCLAVSLALLARDWAAFKALDSEADELPTKSFFCRASLAMTAQYLQLPMMYDFLDPVDGTTSLRPASSFNEPRGRTRGAHALHRYYQCGKDKQWVVITGCAAFCSKRQRDEAWSRLKNAVPEVNRISFSTTGHGASEDTDADEKHRIAVLTDFCAARESTEVINMLKHEAGEAVVICARLRSIAEIRDKHKRAFPIDASSEGSATYPFVTHAAEMHPAKMEVTQIQALGCVRNLQSANDNSQGVRRDCCPAVKFGAHTLEFLQKELGFSASEVKELLDQGVVSESATEGGVYFPE